MGTRPMGPCWGTPWRLGWPDWGSPSRGPFRSPWRCPWPSALGGLVILHLESSAQVLIPPWETSVLPEAGATPTSAVS